MAPTPFDDTRLDELQRRLDQTPAPLEPLDASMLDGFLCGVLVQPRRLAPALWLPYVTDAEARPLPSGFDTSGLHALVQQRHAELDAAIEQRAWFDPWVFELDPESGHAHDDPAAAIEAVYPWVAGFALAMSAFPALQDGPAAELLEPLALLYRHLDPDDLEDADQLLETIATQPEPEDLAEAVQDLVRAVLLLADVGRPLTRVEARPQAPRRAGAPRCGRSPRGAGTKR
jgi:uncharacterized protein